MKSQAVQELVKKIFGDENARLQFVSDPDSVLAQYNLTEQEKKAALSTHFKLGLVTSDSPQMEAAIDPMAGWNAPTP